MRDISKPFINVQYEKVDLGAEMLDIPVARLQGGAPGLNLLITAGLDGDEYAGIEAAYSLIEEFSTTSFNGSLIIIPVVNIEGFRAKTSENPIDGKFPKNIYPGKKNGSSTERLCHWLYTIAFSSDFWLDMHGGALTEIITPHAASWKSGKKNIDDLVLAIVQKLPCKHAVFEQSACKTKTNLLSKYNCGYIMTEFGQGNNNGKISIDRHIQSARVVMDTLNIIDYPCRIDQKIIFSRVDEYTSKQNGVWKPKHLKTQKVNKKELIGEIVSSKGDVCERVYARQDGMILWEKVKITVQKGDILAGVGN